ncbi:MAG: hypothetical protein R3E32_03935 [Chitinophagales bacterium]
MKITTCFLFLISILLPFTISYAQESYKSDTIVVADSSKTVVKITQLYDKFFELENKSSLLTTEITSTVTGLKSNFEEISGTLENLQNQQSDFGSVVETSKAQLQTLTAQQQEILDAQTAKMKGELEERCHQVVETAAFIKTANVSLNTLVLSNALTDYLNKVSDLNNPTNEDLGFSITEKVIQMVEQDIFKNEKKVGDKKKGKFLGVVSSLINNPITQTFTLGMSGVVTALTGVDQMVTNAALEEDDVSVEDLEAFRLKLRQYVVHYQALSHSNTQFEHKLTGIKTRIEALQQLMANFVGERVSTLYDQGFAESDLTLTQLIQKEFDVRDIQQHVEKLKVAYTENGELQYEKILADQRLFYPAYALNQTRFIFDEIDALSQEYVLALQEYQTNIEDVLTKAKTLGDAEKIDKKIEALRSQLESVEMALTDAVNIADVRAQFFALSNVGK